MSRPRKRTPAGELLTGLTMDIFRVNNLLLCAGDRLVRGLGLTSVRWQMLGCIFRAGQPQTVSWLARNLGANRQNVQRIVNDLHVHGFVAFKANPRHRRAQLVALTAKGLKSYGRAMELQAPWANGITKDLSVTDLEVFWRVLLTMRERLEGAGDPG